MSARDLAQLGSGTGAAGEDQLRSRRSTRRRCGGPWQVSSRTAAEATCRGVSGRPDRGRVRSSPPVHDSTGLVDAAPRPRGPATDAGLPLLETADTQQAALRDGDRAGERGQVVTGDYLRERSGHGPRRLITVRRAQHQEAGVPTWRVRPDVAPGDRAVTGRSASMEGPARRGPHAHMSPPESLDVPEEDRRHTRAHRRTRDSKDAAPR